MVYASLIIVACRIHHSPMQYTSFGKPKPFVFKNAETILRQLQPSSCNGDNENLASHAFDRQDIPGFQFRGKENHAEFPVDPVVDTVEDAVNYTMKREGTSCSQ